MSATDPLQVLKYFGKSPSRARANSRDAFLIWSTDLTLDSAPGVGQTFLFLPLLELRIQRLWLGIQAQTSIKASQLLQTLGQSPAEVVAFLLARLNDVLPLLVAQPPRFFLPRPRGLPFNVRAAIFHNQAPSLGIPKAAILRHMIP